MALVCIIYARSSNYGKEVIEVQHFEFVFFFRIRYGLKGVAKVATIPIETEKVRYIMEVFDAVSDVSRAIQSMILTAWAQGIGSNWVGFDNLKHINPVLGIPEEIEILSILPFGYPVEAIGKGQKKRKPLSEIAHRERWNQPFV